MITSKDAVLRCIGEILRSQPTTSEDGSYTFQFRDTALPPISQETVSGLVQAINLFEEIDDSSVITKTSYEVLVQSGARSFRLFRDDLSIEDPHSGLSYKLGAPSDAYLVYLCLKVTETDRGHDMRYLRMIPGSMIRERVAREHENPSAFDFMRTVLRVFTLTIKSETARPKSSWRQNADAFYFHVAYNLDTPLMPDRYLSELLRPARISSTRRSKLVELDAPRRHYVSDLVYHYQLGVSAESPMLEYMRLMQNPSFRPLIRVARM